MPERSDQQTLYHIATVEDWEARTAGHYQPAGYHDEGFIHCSSAAQLPGTLRRHYSAPGRLMLLTIESRAISAAVVWEDLHGIGVEFPHVYGPLESSAVVDAVAMPSDPESRIDWVVGRLGESSATGRG